MSDDELGLLRAEIDHLDEEIIRNLSLRFIATSKVGHLKAAHSLEAVDPSREAAQAQRYSVLAERYGVSAELIQKVFRTVIDEVVINHQTIRDNTSKQA
ncbi:chorismate mutase [Pseudomonas sp. 3A(2025)]